LLDTLVLACISLLEVEVGGETEYVESVGDVLVVKFGQGDDLAAIVVPAVTVLAEPHRVAVAPDRSTRLLEVLFVNDVVGVPGPPGRPAHLAAALGLGLVMEALTGDVIKVADVAAVFAPALHANSP
jgi:hypothetical protein